MTGGRGFAEPASGAVPVGVPDAGGSVVDPLWSPPGGDWVGAVPGTPGPDASDCCCTSVAPSSGAGGPAGGAWAPGSLAGAEASGATTSEGATGIGAAGTTAARSPARAPCDGATAPLFEWPERRGDSGARTAGDAVSGVRLRSGAIDRAACAAGACVARALRSPPATPPSTTTTASAAAPRVSVAPADDAGTAAMPATW